MNAGAFWLFSVTLIAVAYWLIPALLAANLVYSIFVADRVLSWFTPGVLVLVIAEILLYEATKRIYRQ
jgi:hypothetical protein